MTAKDFELPATIMELVLSSTEMMGRSSTRTELARAVTEAQYARSSANEFLEVHFKSGKRDTLYRGDMASGAIIAAIVERAKSLAIGRSIQSGIETFLSREDLLTALTNEYAENDLFPSTDITEDWMKLTDFDPENVVRLGPVRPRKSHALNSGMV